VLRRNRNAKGLTFSELGVLGRLRRDGAATATDLSDYLRVKPQSLTRLLAHLEQRGFVARKSNDDDRRKNLIEITEAGERVLFDDVRDQRSRLAKIVDEQLTVVEQEMLALSTGLMERIIREAEKPSTKPGKPKRHTP
jgi:DNA-binding MarR family transcriptional regulator